MFRYGNKLSTTGQSWRLFFPPMSVRICILAVLGSCFMNACSSAENAKPAAIGAEVRVTGGMVRGLVSGEGDDALKQYHGIPYAAPPVGELRWAPPAAVIPWTKTLDATKHGQFCSQPVVI
ncbi:MAG: carboxylesterase family protein, partial [Pseudomonadales bacterium]